MAKKDLEIGIFLGLTCRKLTRSAQKPTSYSYNGIVLPVLPERDEEAYPYALIYHRDNDAKYCLLYMSQPMICRSSGTLYIGALGTPVNGSEYLSYIAESGSWVVGDTRGVQNCCLDWTNKDLHYDADAGGGVYMSGSQPIPVYN